MVYSCARQRICASVGGIHNGDHEKIRRPQRDSCPRNGRIARRHRFVRRARAELRAGKGDAGCSSSGRVRNHGVGIRHACSRHGGLDCRTRHANHGQWERAPCNRTPIVASSLLSPPALPEQREAAEGPWLASKAPACSGFASRRGAMRGEDGSPSPMPAAVRCAQRPDGYTVKRKAGARDASIERLRLELEFRTTNPRVLTRIAAR